MTQTTSLKLVANDSSLEINESGKFEFRLRSAEVWKTDAPLVVLHYYDRQHPRAQVVSVPSSEQYAYGTPGTGSLSAVGRIELQQNSAGSAALVVHFPQIFLTLELKVTLDENGAGFRIRLEKEGVSESHSRLYRILSLEVLPEFGAARSGESGYLVLPNWSGCQTFFNKAYPREVRQTLYSSNDQWENACNMPVFGIHRNQGTLCGLVAAGDFDAQLVCRVHWEERQANSVHPLLVYRWQQEDEMLAGPREVRYRFAPAEYDGGEGYVLCGKTYREFLRAERGLLSWDEKAAKRPVVLEYRDRYFLKIFMAYKEPAADGHGPYYTTCTFDEAREILEDCLARGIKKLTAILVGWGRDGHDGMPPTRFPVDDRLGGEEAMKRLISWCKEKDILLGVHDSYGAMFPASPEFNTEDLVCHRSGEYWESIIWSGGQVHVICPAVFVEKHVKRDLPAIRNLGVYGHHHIDAVGSFMTCYSKDHPLEKRADYVNGVRKMFEFATQTIGSVSTEMPFGPYFDVVDGFFHSFTHPYKFHRASDVGRYFLDRSIPLVPIALHGSVNCGENIGYHSLHHLDWGLTLQTEVCVRPSSAYGILTYDRQKEELAKRYELYYGPENLVQRFAGLWIEERRELAADVHTTRYSDGTRVVVNRGKESWNGIEPDSYRIEAPTS